MSYHAKDGLTFTRLTDGSVQVIYPGDSYDTEIILDRDTWCSVVAAVSLGGETGETFRRALALHMESKTYA